MSEEVVRHAVTSFPTRADQVEWNLDALDEHLVNLVTPASFEADQYRNLRHEMQRTHPTKKLIAVTSAVDGDGKTTTAINLAAALAEAPEARTLLWDLDLRTPSVGNRLGLSAQSPSLADLILEPTLRPDDVIRRHPRFRLSILPAGPASTVPYKLLKHPRMAEILREVHQQYDYIVFDTPPLLPVPDSRLVADLMDGFIIVVGAQRTTRKLLGDVLALANASKILGIVFNRDDRPLHGYYRYYHGCGYDEGRARRGGWRGNGHLTSAVDKTLRPFLSWIGYPRE